MIKYIGNRGWEKYPSSTIQECLNFLNTLKFIGLDTETEGFDSHTKKLLLLQLGNRDVQYVIDCLTTDITPLKEILESKTILIHNAMFDWKFMYHSGIDIKNIYDTFLAEVILHTGYNLSKSNKPFYIPTALDKVVYKYTGNSLDKSVRGDIHKGLTEAVIEYAARDIQYLEDVMNSQLIEIDKWDLGKVIELENKVVRVFSKMCYTGIGFNTNKLKEVTDELDNINQDLINKLDDIIIQESTKFNALKKYTRVQYDLFSEVRPLTINWSSPAQKTDVLNKLGIKCNSVDDKTLQQNKTKHKIVPLFIEYSKYAKLSSSFGKPLLNFINKVTKRIHPEVWQILVTGRISMSNPNCQQIPSHSTLGRKIKSCFVPREGYKFVSADYSGFELKVIAELSQDPLWVKTFKDGGDLHSILCAETFDISIEDVKKPFPPKPDISYRFLQKTINFGLSYGMSKFKLSETAQIRVNDADKIIKKFFSKVPLVEKFLNLLARTGVKLGYIRTDLHYRRIRFFPQLDRDNFKTVGEVERASKNSIPQGINANTTKQALIDLQDIIDRNDYPVFILLTIHDEILTECREDFVDIWRPILEDTMIKAAQVVIKTIPVKVDSVVSDYWTD
jgi:DNA polymerase-1